MSGVKRKQAASNAAEKKVYGYKNGDIALPAGETRALANSLGTQTDRLAAFVAQLGDQARCMAEEMCDDNNTPLNDTEVYMARSTDMRLMIIESESSLLKIDAALRQTAEAVKQVRQHYLKITKQDIGGRVDYVPSSALSDTLPESMGPALENPLFADMFRACLAWSKERHDSMGLYVTAISLFSQHIREHEPRLALAEQQQPGLVNQALLLVTRFRLDQRVADAQAAAKDKK